MVIRGVGVEIGPAGFDYDLTQEASRRKLMRGAVNGCERHPHIGSPGLGVKPFGRYVAVLTFKKRLRQGQTLTRQPQTDRLEAREYVGKPSLLHHAIITRYSMPGCSDSHQV